MRNDFLEAIAPDRTLPPPEIVSAIKAKLAQVKANLSPQKGIPGFDKLPYSDDNLKAAREYLESPHLRDSAVKWAWNNSDDVEIKYNELGIAIAIELIF